MKESLYSRFVPEQFIKEVQELYSRGLSYTIFAGFLAALVVSLVLGYEQTHNIILFWFSSYGLVCFARYYSYVNFHNRSDDSIQSASFWFVLLIFGSIITGLLWGALGIILSSFVAFQPDQLLFINSFLVVIIAALTASSTIIYTSNPVLMLSFSLSALVPYSVYLLHHQWSYLSLIGGMLLLFYFFLLAVYSRLDIAVFRAILNRVYKPPVQSDTQ